MTITKRKLEQGETKSLQTDTGRRIYSEIFINWTCKKCLSKKMKPSSVRVDRVIETYIAAFFKNGYCIKSKILVDHGHRSNTTRRTKKKSEQIVLLATMKPFIDYWEQHGRPVCKVDTFARVAIELYFAEPKIREMIYAAAQKNGKNDIPTFQDLYGEIMQEIYDTFVIPFVNDQDLDRPFSLTCRFLMGKKNEILYPLKKITKHKWRMACLSVGKNLYGIIKKEAMGRKKSMIKAGPVICGLATHMDPGELLINYLTWHINFEVKDYKKRVLLLTELNDLLYNIDKVEKENNKKEFESCWSELKARRKAVLHLAGKYEYVVKSLMASKTYKVQVWNKIMALIRTFQLCYENPRRDQTFYQELDTINILLTDENREFFVKETRRLLYKETKDMDQLYKFGKSAKNEIIALDPNGDINEEYRDWERQLMDKVFEWKKEKEMEEKAEEELYA